MKCSTQWAIIFAQTLIGNVAAILAFVCQINSILSGRSSAYLHIYRLPFLDKHMKTLDGQSQVDVFWFGMKRNAVATHSPKICCAFCYFLRGWKAYYHKCILYWNRYSLKLWSIEGATTTAFTNERRFCWQHERRIKFDRGQQIKICCVSHCTTKYVLT